MVAFFDAYTSLDFQKISERLRLHEFVQLPTAQIEDGAIVQLPIAQSGNGAIVQLPTAQLDHSDDYCADFPLFLSLTTGIQALIGEMWAKQEIDQLKMFFGDSTTITLYDYDLYFMFNRVVPKLY